MAEVRKTILDLPSVASAGATDLFPLWQGGTKKATLLQLATYLQPIIGATQAFIDVATSATVALAATASENIRFTGVTTVSSLGTATSGVRRFCYTDSTFTFTNGAALVCPGGVNLTVTPGDSWTLVARGGKWVIEDHQRADGMASIVAAITAASLPVGTIVDCKYAEYTANADLSTAIPLDDTLPQSGEGTQVCAVSITPKSTTNRVRWQFVAYGDATSAGASLIAAIFGSSANAIDAGLFYDAGSGAVSAFVVLQGEYVPGVTTAVTISARVGASAGTCRLNGYGSSRLLGGAMKAALIVEEIKA